MNVLDTTGLQTQVGYIKAYADNKVAALANDSNQVTVVARAKRDEDGNIIKTTYLKWADTGSSAGDVPVFNASGHLVLPSGIEIY